MGDLPAKQSNRSPQILDFAGMGEQQGNRNHPSKRRSFLKECFSKHALIAKIHPKTAKTSYKLLQIIPVVLICRVRNVGNATGPNFDAVRMSGR
jgi:hypothetical protein